LKVQILSFLMSGVEGVQLMHELFFLPSEPEEAGRKLNVYQKTEHQF
jgi:hypothetical protein